MSLACRTRSALFWFLVMVSTGNYVLGQTLDDIQQLMRMAEQGRADAAYRLGYLYAHKDKNEENVLQAVKYLRLAAKLGEFESKYALGAFLIETKVASHVAEGVEVLSSMADVGHLPAAQYLASHYMSQKPRDVALILTWLRKSADLGDPLAAYNAGLFLVDGKAETFNIDLGFHYLRVAANHDVPEAARVLGDLYRRGIETKKNMGRAIDWYLKAANLGDPLAQYNLAYAYFTGDGVKADISSASKWANEAAKQDLPEAESLNGLLCDDWPEYCHD